MRSVRLRVLVLVTLGLTLAACTSSQTNAPTTTVPSKTRPLPVVDLSATPAEWVPIAFGDAQVSVPPTWWVLYHSFTCPGGNEPGEVLVNPVPGSPFCPRPPKMPTTVTLTIPARPPRDYGPKHVINSVTVFGETSYGTGAYFAPSLDIELSFQGPLGNRVLHTLTRSPRNVVLAPGNAPAVPSSWQTVTFAGLRFSVPARWRTYQWVDSGVCGGNGPTLSGDAVWLTKGTHPVECKQPPVLPLVRWPGNGVQVDVDLSSLLVTGSFSAHCLTLRGLSACPPTSPAYSILVLKVTVGSLKPVYVSIGLAGNGMVARTILYSLRTSPLSAGKEPTDRA
jgi:hypothetical protein